MTIPLSVLDLAPISAGSDVRTALTNTIDLARHAEAFGYSRYWIAEHHFVAVGSAAPIVLAGLIASATTTIRVGTAAVQTGHNTAASVIEGFGTVDALHPGRLDLGLGRSGQRRNEELAAAGPPPERAARTVDGVLIPPPFSPATILNSTRVAASFATIQQRDAQSPDFAEFVDDIRAFVAGTYTTADGVALHATPGEGADVELWIFGSSAGQSARVAGALGIPFVANYHVSPGTVLEAVDAYRSAFRPSDRYPEPYLVVSADFVTAPTAAQARERAASYGHWVYSIRSGQGALPYPDPAEVAPLTPDEHRLVADRVETQFVGDPAEVAAGLRRLQRLTGANELVVTGITHDHGQRVESHRLLAQVWAATT